MKDCLSFAGYVFSLGMNKLCALGIMVLLSGSVMAQNKKPTVVVPPKPVVLKGTEATLTMDRWGSAFSAWKMQGKDINPYDWSLTTAQMPKNNQVGPPFRGHFLCVGRWGAPSDGEILKGMPHNGEVNTLAWNLDQPLKDGKVKTSLNLPLEQMRVTREVAIHPKGTSFQVKETFTNELNLGRIHNVVQHATIGGAFLNPSTLIDCNADEGFDQRVNPEKLDSAAFTWPDGKLPDGPADLRTVNDDRGYVTTHIFSADKKLGWITATDPTNGLLMGYVWYTAEYPWVNVWHWKKDGKPHAHGLEFGTCGLGKPYKLLLEKRVSFRGKNMFDYIDAGETQTKRYMAFMLAIPTDFKGVADIKLDGKVMLIKERGGQNRTITQEVVGMPQ